jgi:hypothetical protein
MTRRVVIYWIAKGRADFNPTGHMAANGFGEHSPFNYSLGAVVLAEVLLYPLLFGRAEELADRPVRDDALEN